MKRDIRHWRYIAVLCIVVATGALSLNQGLESRKMHTLAPGLQAFDVNSPAPHCGRWRDTMPRTRDPSAYRLYIDARRLWRSKIEWQLTRPELLHILKDVQTAANQGDWGARALLAYFYRSGLGPLESNHVLNPDANKAVEIVRMAVGAGQAWGYYDLGVAYEHGYGEVNQDLATAWAYYLRAAELGSPEAQMTLASAYQKAKQWEAEKAMIDCAYSQGHGAAAHKLGIKSELRKEFTAALKYYQAGTGFGNADSAGALMIMFAIQGWNSFEKSDQDALKKVAIVPDPEREKRYTQIYNALEINPDLRLAHLNAVLPLPPTDLPAWRGIEDAIEPELDVPLSY